MKQPHISRFHEEGFVLVEPMSYFVLVEPMSYEDKIRKILSTIYLSRFDINYLSRIERLEYEVDNIKEEMRELRKNSVENPLSFLSQKLSSRGKYAVLRNETFDLLFITNSEREAFTFSLNEPNSMILRLK